MHTENIAENRLKMKVVNWKANYRYRSNGASAASVICLPNDLDNFESVPSDVLSMLVVSLADCK